MTVETGIMSFGAYIPRGRLQRAAVHATNAWFAPGLAGLAKGERAIANWDEDSVTMAVEAARDALSGIDRDTIRALSLASTTLPFSDRLNAGIVKEALTLPDEVGAIDVSGSRRAATSSLIRALEAARSGGAPQLCIAADLRKARPASEAELVNGDAAAALVIGQGDIVARLIGSYSLTVDFIDQFRAAGAAFDYAWETRWVRDEGYLGLVGKALSDALASINLAPERVDRLIVPISARGIPEALARKAGIKPEAVADTLSATVGDSGAASPFLLLAAALEQAGPGEILILVGFGQGVDVLAFETTSRLASQKRLSVSGCLARGVKDTNYARWLFHRGLLDLDRGMRAEMDQKQPGTTLWRNRKAVLGLVGGRCTKTGTVQFPKSDIGVNANDHAIGTQEDYRLADIPATVVTYTADSLTYSPAPPSYYGMVDFDGGGRLVTEFTDLAAADIEVGQRMRMMFRIKAFDDQRDFVKYFWKAVPITAAEIG